MMADAKIMGNDVTEEAAERKRKVLSNRRGRGRKKSKKAVIISLNITFFCITVHLIQENLTHSVG